jgi:DegV family protein with EDD domain
MRFVVAASRGSPVRIVTDSSACLTEAEAARLGVSVLPLTLVIGGREYADNAGPGRDDFYRRLREASDPPRTAALAPGALLDSFRALDVPQIVCITVAAAYSATHANAILAAKQAAEDGIDVRVVDSETAAAAAGYVVRAAAGAAAAGASIDEVVAIAEHTRSEVGVLMLLEGLDYLARGGRVPRIAAWASGLLSFRPIVELRDRKIRLAGRARTRRGGIDSLVDILAHRLRPDCRLHLTVQHAGAAVEAEALAALATERLAPVETEIVEFSQVMAAHVGPGILGFSYRLEAAGAA